MISSLRNSSQPLTSIFKLSEMFKTPLCGHDTCRYVQNFPNLSHANCHKVSNAYWIPRTFTRVCYSCHKSSNAKAVKISIHKFTDQASIVQNKVIKCDSCGQQLTKIQPIEECVECFPSYISIILAVARFRSVNSHDITGLTYDVIGELLLALEIKNENVSLAFPT